MALRRTIDGERMTPESAAILLCEYGSIDHATHARLESEIAELRRKAGLWDAAQERPINYSDKFQTMSKAEQKDWLREQGATFRSDSTKDDLIAACRRITLDAPLRMSEDQFRRALDTLTGQGQWYTYADAKRMMQELYQGAHKTAKALEYAKILHPDLAEF